MKNSAGEEQWHKCKTKVAEIKDRITGTETAKMVIAADEKGRLVRLVRLVLAAHGLGK